MTLRRPDADDCLHRLVERRAGLVPGAVAVRVGGRVLTYRELDEGAERLAGPLLDLGVLAEDRVGVCLPRDLDLPVALLAVLKAGACYVPMEPSNPPARLRRLAHEAGVRAVIHAGSPERFPASLESIDLAAHDPASGPADRPAVPVLPRQLAYVISTSGSTGRPRAVAVEHRSAVARMRWARSAFSDAELGGVLAATSVAFDLSVFELFAPLCWGGTVILVPDALTASDAEGVSLVSAVPSALAELVAADALPAGVVTYCVAGERLPGALVERLYRRPGTRRVLNLYGPTEGTVYATWHEADRDAGDPPIGVPLPGTEAWVLDGELHLSGGLARGYLNDPRRTAERFVPHPRPATPGERMYRTGDLVRTDDAGRLVFVGRADDQVKLRGHRIELGDVGAALAAVPGARSAAAAVLDGPSGAPGLVGFIVAEDDRLTDETVFDALRATVPGYLIPERLTRLDRLPTDQRGKLDRSALATAAGEPVDVEEAVRAAWREQIGANPGPDDDFFEAGGDSLLATWLVAKLGEAVGARVEISAVFEHPRFGELVEHLRESTPAVPGGTRRTQAGNAAKVYPPSYAQRGMWHSDQLTPGDTAYLIRAVITVESEAGPDVLEAALHDVIARHPALRTGFEQRDEELVAVVHADVALDIPRGSVAGPEALAGHLAALDAVEAATPMDLTRPPLVRSRMVLCDGRPVAVLLTAHHIIFDARSLELFVRDLGLCHRARLAGAPPPERSCPDPAEIAERHRTWLAGSDGRRCLAELSAATARAVALDPFPTDLPRAAERGTGGASLIEPLSPDTVRTLRDIAARHRASRFMVGLAAFSHAVASWSGRRDLVIGAAFGGRTDADASDVIDCLTNVVPVLVRVEPGEPFPALLARVRATALFTAEHQDVPFEALVDRLRPARSMAYNPLVQVAFGAQDVERPAYQDPSLRLRAEEVEPDRARLDLTVWIEESGDGARAVWTYSTELFRTETIAALHGRFVAALREARTGGRPPTQQRRTAVDTDQYAPRVIRRRGPRTAAAPSVGLPARVHADRAGSTDLSRWISANRDRVDDLARAAGAVLLRGFDVTDAAGFGDVVNALSSEILGYGERSSPRSRVAEGVYTSTDHPADLPIELHNEQSYTLDWPLRIVFFCETAPTDRGRTPLADSRRVLAELRPATVAAFERHGVRYVRNYLPGLGLSWQEAFQTEDRDEVARHCRAADIAWEWIGDEQLRTVQVRPATRVHPVTGERAWFNHALFFHVTSMPAGAELLAAVGEADLPYQTYYGDGRPIEDEVLAELRAAYAAHTTSFSWQRGDVLVVENMLTAHAREPFSGPRRILTAMADPVSYVLAVSGKAVR